MRFRRKKREPEPTPIAEAANRLRVLAADLQRVSDALIAKHAQSVGVPPAAEWKADQ